MSSAKPSLELLRSLTDEHVLRALMDQRRLTRAEVAARTGISKPTISEAFRRLEAAGVVVDTGERSQGRGRAGSYYTLAPGCGAALVVGITPHGVVTEVVDAFGDVTGAADAALVGSAEQGAVARALQRSVRAALPGQPGAPGEALRIAAVSVADPVDRATGRLVHLPDAPFLVGDLVPAQLLAEVVDGPVLVDNDVNWAARAEQASGATSPVAGLRDFVYLYLDEGLGCAVVADGEVRRGHSGLAGEIAHVVTSGPGGRAMPLTEVFARLDLRRPGSTAVDVPRVLSAGPATLEALGAAVCGVLAAAVALGDPEVVVVGGGWGSGVAFVEELRRQAARLPRPVPVVPARVSARPELAGARSAALARLRDVIVHAARETRSS